jgi:ArsR family transcriptional regulator
MQELKVGRAGTVLPESLPGFLRLLAEPNRLRILVFLTHGECCVCDIESELRLPQNLLSHHLGLLRRAGVLQDRKEGRWVYYSIAPGVLEAHLDTLADLLDTRDASRRAQPCSSGATG